MEKDPHTKLEELYDSMSAALRDNLKRTGILTEEAFDRAMKETKSWAKDFYADHEDEIQKVAQFITRDFYSMMGREKSGPRPEGAGRVDLEQLAAIVLMAVRDLATAAGFKLEALARNLREEKDFLAGEAAGPGSYRCTGCGHGFTQKKTAVLAPCPKCQAPRFKRK